MTRKRFFKLRLALVTRINEFYAGTPIENPEKGKGYKALRDHNPVVNGDHSSYADCWHSIECLCEIVGLEVRK